MKKRWYALLLIFALLFAGCGKEQAKTAETDAVKVQEVGKEKNSEKSDNSENLESTENSVDETAGASASDKETGKEISLVMVGDVLLHDPVTESGKMTDGTYNYDHLFAKVKDMVEDADLALVNQEVILGGKELGLSGYPTFNGAYEVGDALSEAGFDVVLHATNHALDKGKKGLLNCLSYWRNNHSEMAVLGIYDNQADYDRNCTIYEKEGMKIAILNYTYGTNGISLPSDMPYAVSLLKETKIKEDLARAEAEADFTIVCPHWGTEYSHTASACQKKWAKLMVENGADLIIGTHPHVIQPVEWMEAEEHKALVYYSLGNFINATSGSGAGTTDRMVGGMAQVTLRQSETGQVEIEEYGVEPLITHLRYETGQMTTYPLAEYTEELAAENETGQKDSSFSLEYCKKLCQQVFGELYRQP